MKYSANIFQHYPFVDFKDASILTDLLVKGKYEELLGSKAVEWILGDPNGRLLDEQFLQTVLNNIEKCMNTSDLSSRKAK